MHKKSLDFSLYRVFTMHQVTTHNLSAECQLAPEIVYTETVYSNRLHETVYIENVYTHHPPHKHNYLRLESKVRKQGLKVELQKKKSQTFVQLR